MSQDHSSSRRRITFDPLTGYSVLDLIRKPSLVPTDRLREYRAVRREVYRVRTEIEQLGVISRLTAQHQLELAACVLDIDSAHEAWHQSKAGLLRLKIQSKRGPAHTRHLAQRLA